MPRARSHTGKYFTLSYYNPTSGQYGLGKDDGFLIFFCIILFTGLRAATLEYLFAPYAKSKGISKRKDITRFSEQAWLLIYYSVFWTLGLVRFSFLFSHAMAPPSFLSGAAQRGVARVNIRKFLAVD